MDSISPPNRPHYPWKQGEILIADELNAAIANAGHGTRVTDWIPGGQPDGVTDLAVYFQAAIDDAADADPADRASAPGLTRLIVPANPLPYIIGTALLIPSHSHIVIEQGATLKIGDGANQSCLLNTPGATNVFVEHYGTLDGNASMQTFGSTTADLFDFERSGGGASCGFGSLGPCTNIVMDGGGLQGLITNFWNWPVNIVSATNALVRGVRMTNCGNSVEFAGITTRISVTGGSYVGNTGVLTLSTAGTGGGPHGINVGDAFTWVAVPGADPIVYLQGEFVALTVPDAYTVTCNAGIGNAPSIPSGSFPAYPNAGRVGTCTRCSNVGFEDCYVADIRDIGMCLYSGCTGSYIRNCELERASGPILFCDAGQPASNRDCEISGNYTHGGRGGPGSASNETGCFSFNSQIFDNIVANNLSGCAIGGSDGVSFHGNLLHGNIPAVQVSTGYGSQLLIPGVSKTNVFDNTVRDPLPAPARHGVAQLVTTAGANTYNSATGIVSLTTATAHNVTVGATFYVQNLFGLNNPTTAYLQLNGKWICLSAPSSTTLTYQGPIGLGTVNLGVTGQVWSNAYPLPVAHIAPGTYTSDATGLLSLTTVEMHGYDTVNFTSPAPFVLSSGVGTAMVGGLPVPFPLVGLFQAQAGTVNSTLTLITTPNATFVLTAGRVLPPSFGIAIDGPDYCRISGNRIGDYGSPRSLTACIGGTWGTNGSSDGNYFGPRNAVDPDVSLYILGSVNGLNHDLIYSSVLTNSNIAGQVTFLGSTQASAGGLGYYQPQGLTPGWNYNAGRGEVDFLLGEGAGSPGGFNFLQIMVIKIASGTYDPATGNVVLTTDRAHGVQVGGTFVISNLKDSAGGTDVGTLGGGRTATTGTTGTTLTYTVARLGLTVAPITGGQVVPDGAAGGVIKTTVGVAGSLLANDGLGNTRLGGALVHGAIQTATLANGGTVTVPQNTSFMLVNNSSSIATGNLVLPAPAASSYQTIGSQLDVRFQNPVGALTVTAATGAAVAGPPTTVLSAGASFRFIQGGPGAANTWLPCIPDVSGTPPVGGPYLPISGGAVTGALTVNGLLTATAGITGSGINSTPIGATTPSTGVFTSETITGLTTITGNAAAVPPTIAGTLLQITGANSNSPRLKYNAYGAAFPFLTTQVAEGTAAAPTATVSGRRLFVLDHYGHDGTGFTANARAQYLATAEGDWSSTSTPTYLNWYTTAVGSTTVTERMRLNSAGELLLGGVTSSNGYKLQVHLPATSPDAAKGINSVIDGITGTTAAVTAINSISVSSDNSSTGGSNMLNLSYFFGGNNFSGSAAALNIGFSMRQPSIPSYAIFYMGANIYATAEANAGGTGLTDASSKGNLYGLNITPQLSAGATYWTELTSCEIDSAILATASVSRRVNLKLVLANNHAVQGAVEDAFLNLARGRLASAGSLNGVQFGSITGQFPIDNTNGIAISHAYGSVVVAGVNPQLKTFIDASHINALTAHWLSPGASLDGSGNRTIGPAKLAWSASGVSLDVFGQVGGTPTILAGGAGAITGQIVTTGNGDLYTVTASTGVVTALTVIVPATSRGVGSVGGQTIQGDGLSGATCAIPWTNARTLSLQPSGGAITSPLLTNAANDGAAASAGVAVGQWYRNGSILMQRVA